MGNFGTGATVALGQGGTGFRATFLNSRDDAEAAPLQYFTQGIDRATALSEKHVERPRRRTRCDDDRTLAFVQRQGHSPTALAH